jgi:hypothetical protein
MQELYSVFVRVILFPSSKQALEMIVVTTQILVYCTHFAEKYVPRFKPIQYN